MKKKIKNNKQPNAASLDDVVMYKTADEARVEFLKQIHDIAKYWAELEDKTSLEKCNGVIFSILNIFDGTTIELPAMDIVLRPHRDDQQYCIEHGEKYYKNGMVINDCLLHEQFYI